MERKSVNAAVSQLHLTSHNCATRIYVFLLVWYNIQDLPPQTKNVAYIFEEVQGDYFCEVCDRSWETQEELDEHLSEHIGCHFEGCMFTAAPKLVALHVKLQHDSGAFEKIIKSNDMEEIRKWKEERKRNYPTLENIERKIAQNKEMEERGERMKVENKPFDQGKGFSLKQDHKPNERGKFKDRRRRRRKSNIVKNNQQFLSTASVTEEMVVEGQEAGKGNDNISDDEWLGEEKVTGVKSAPVSSVLQALSTSYATDSEDENENERTNVNQLICSSEVNDESPSEIKISRVGDETPNIHIEKAERDEDKVQNKISQKDNPTRKQQPAVQSRNTQWKSCMRKRPLTLLEKLLAKEIKQERNYILQCVRYIVEEKFFENEKMTT